MKPRIPSLRPTSRLAMRISERSRRRTQLPVQTVPLVLMLAAVVWFIAAPGIGTFFVAVAAFLLWATAALVDYLLKQFARGKEKLERLFDSFLEENAGEADRWRKEDLPEDEALRELWDEFETAAKAPGLRELAHRAKRQLRMLPGLLENFQGVLQKKLGPTELTYDRYLGSMQKAYEATLSELEEVASRMRGLSPLLEDQRFRSRQLDSIRLILDRNEDALVQMGRINIAVSEMKGIAHREESQLDQAILDLKELAERAKKY